MERELTNKTFHPGRSICFVVTEPKPREIFAADFRDRVVHHLLVGRLEPVWEKIFIHHSYACRRQKGAHAAIRYLKKFIRQASRDYSRPAYYLQLDIAGFFMSLNKKILFALIAKRVKSPDLLWLAEQIIFHDPTKNFHHKGDPGLYKLIPAHKTLFKVPADQGLPIGNLTSQFFANIYLNELDQFAKHRLKIKYFSRYVDDVLILHDNPEQLKIWRGQMDEFLKEKLQLSFHPLKTVLRPVDQGINFVGFIVFPRHTLIRNRTVRKLKNKLWLFNQRLRSRDLIHPIRLWSPELCGEFLKILATINSYYGQFIHADTFRLRRHLYEKHFVILKIYLLPADKDCSYFIWSND
ncbi:MAG: reverse transcriptase/maturase family protein [bacterium]|nr:reverse transcriptase/maturase family protein [bacterium]